MELLDVSGYTHPRAAESTEAEVRRMLRRLHVTDADTYLLMGMTRKLLWKLRSQREGCRLTMPRHGGTLVAMTFCASSRFSFAYRYWFPIAASAACAHPDPR